MKLLRKKNGRWIVVAAAALSLAVAESGAMTSHAEEMGEDASSEVAAQLADEVSDLHLSEFEDKEIYLADQEVEDYIEETIEKYDRHDDEINTVEQVKAEIQKQIDLGLPAYVVQPGDTLSVIAEALTISYDELYDANGFEDEPVRLTTGDLLDQVLSHLVTDVKVSTGQTMAQPVRTIRLASNAQVSAITSRQKLSVEDKSVEPEVPVELSEPSKPSEPSDLVEPEPEPEEPSEPVTPQPKPEAEEVVEYRNRTVTETLPYETRVIKDETAPEGDRVVVQEGQTGTVFETYQDKYVNGEKVSSELVHRRVLDPVTEIIKVNPKDLEPEAQPTYRVEKTTETTAIPYETVRRESDDYELGYEEVVTQGVDGSLTITYENIYLGDVLVDRIEVDRHEVEMIPEVIIVGTKVKEETPAPFEIKTVKETITIPFKTIRQETDQLDQGQTRVSQIGKNGTVEVTYQEVYQNGKLVRRSETNRKEIAPVQDHIILVGTKVNQPELNNTDWPTQGLEEGDRILIHEDKATGEKTYQTIESIRIRDTRTLEDFVNMSPEELYNEVTNYQSSSSNIFFTEDGYYYTLALNQESIDKINDVFDYTAFNLEFMKLLNAERSSRGLERMAFSPALYHQQTSIRSEQNAANGRIRFYDLEGNQVPHITRDLKPGETQHSEEVSPNYLTRNSRYVGQTGENAASNGSGSIVAGMLSPRYQAERFFNQWMNSPGHQRAMMSEWNTYFAVATKPSSKIRQTKDEYRYHINTSFGTMSMGADSGDNEWLDFAHEDNIETINGIDLYVIRHADGSVIGFLPVDDADLDYMITNSVDFDFKPVQMDGTREDVVVAHSLDDSSGIQVAKASMTDDNGEQQNDIEEDEAIEKDIDSSDSQEDKSNDLTDDEKVSEEETTMVEPAQLLDSAEEATIVDQHLAENSHSGDQEEESTEDLSDGVESIVDQHLAENSASTEFND